MPEIKDTSVKDGVVKMIRESKEREASAELKEKEMRAEAQKAYRKKMALRKQTPGHKCPGLEDEECLLSLKEVHEMRPRRESRQSSDPNKPGWKPWQPSLIPAVEYVRAQRSKRNLPREAKEEAEQIEERLTRAELNIPSDAPVPTRGTQGCGLPKGASISSELDTYLDTHTFTKKIVYGNWADRVAKELIEWASMPRSPEEMQPMKITEFLREKGIYFRDFKRLMDKHEILQKAHDFAKQALGDIRERNVLENKWNATAGMRMMGHYDENWQKETERLEGAKLKQASASSTDFKALIASVMTPAEPTEEVRLIKEKHASVEHDRKEVE